MKPKDLTQILVEEEAHIARLRETLEDEPSPVAPFRIPPAAGAQPGAAPQAEVGAPSGTNDPLDAFRKLRSKTPRWAFCASGGGIRSACINLGVAQGLAELGLLRRFDYLSTVSGGGYFGSWLSTWIDSVRPAPGKPSSSAWIESELATRVAGAEAEPITNLRVNSNYLTPRMGGLSVDLLTCIMIIIRNLIVNWLIILPAFAALLILPVLIALGGDRCIEVCRESAGRWIWAGIAFFAMGVNGWLAVSWLPGSRNQSKMGKTLKRSPSEPATTQMSSPYNTVMNVRWAFDCLVAFCLAVWAKTYPHDLTTLKVGEIWPLFLVFGLPYVVGAIRVVSHWQDYDANGGFSVVIKALGGAVLSIVLSLLLIYGAIASLVFGAHQSLFLQYGHALFFVIGPAVWLAFILLQNFFIIGCLSMITGDEDREWWSRSNAVVGLMVLAWIVISSVALLGPAMIGYVSHNWGALTALLTAHLAGGGILSKLISSPATPATDSSAPSPVRSVLLHVGTFLFFLVLALLLAWGNFALAAWLQSALLGSAASYESLADPFAWGLLLAFWALVTWGASSVININQFSIHCLYRNRLVRAFIGAVRRAKANGSSKTFDPFTGFDTSDNYDVSQLNNQLPFHVLNITQNLIRPTNLAWQERKASSFTVSPLQTGGKLTGYRPTQDFGKGISIGTAVATSGAAANPSMGYASSPVLSLLMTLFNVRLGWWVGNPGVEPVWRNIGPSFALRPLISEMFGQTSEGQRYVLLSDGGHFEDLGIYEMVQRRCRFMLVVDGGADPKGTFQDLGNAVRKVRVDLGVPIEFLFNHTTQDLANPDLQHMAVARVEYSKVDGADVTDGWILYLKGCLTGDESFDIYQYKRCNDAFPHQSTIDQWFDESQFESYRALGRHSLEKAFEFIKQNSNFQGASLVEFQRLFS